MLTNRARDLVNAGRMAAARPLIAALRRIAPDAIDTMELDARVLHRDGRSAEAEALLDTALATHPETPALLLCRSEMRLENGQSLGAADDAAAAVIADRNNAPAKAMLGVALIQLGRFDEAVLCLREAVQASPRQPNFREAFAQALELAGGSAEALATLEHGIALSPGSVALRVAAIMTAMRARDPATAARLAEAARKAGVADARVFGLLGHGKSLLGDHAGAAGAYEEALKLAPEDPYVRYLVAASGALPSAPRAPCAYVETVFDGYASHFEAHLISLGYRVPGLIRAALLEFLPGLGRGAPVGPVLDLGCGTGMVGVVLSDLAVEGLVGIDISGKMLAEARTKAIYAELRQQDIEAALSEGLQAGGERWALIISADALCYFGELGAVMRGAFAALRPGGLFVFSVEELPDPAVPANDTADPAQAAGNGRGAMEPVLAGLARGSGVAEPWRLGPLGRYAHRADAIAAIAEAAGFVIRARRREVMRHDRGMPVDGIIFVLAHPA
jgi:predicted TPR repeat methyltransferase